MSLTAVLASIPSPSDNEIHLGPIPLRGYAFAIIVGIIAAIWISERRWVARGGKPGSIQDVALILVPLGIIGGRIYHVITDHDLYFGPGKTWYHAFYIWNGGLGVWGAIPLGAVGGMIAARRMHIPVVPLLDTIVPTVALAQGIGRWGNWFNQELYGRPTTLPWGLKIDPSHWPEGRTFPVGTTFHPTFLYECIWDIGVFFLVSWATKRFNLGHGRPIALYVASYCVGRFWIERLRIDTVELNNVLGMRWNDWMSIICFLIAVAYFAWATVNRPGREEIAAPGNGETESPSNVTTV